MDNLYRQILLEHYRNPQNFGHLKKFDKSINLENPLCGDEITFEVTLKDEKIDKVGFVGQGCVISTATASILSEYIKGKKVSDIMKLTKDDLMKIVGIEIGPVRLKCLLLPLEAVQKAISA